MFYSPDTNGFYPSRYPGFDGRLLEIDINRYNELLNGQNKGFIIHPDETGYPMLSPPPEQSDYARADIEKARRMEIAAQQITIIQPAVEGGYAKPSHTTLLADWQRYRYELTLVPEKLGWPESPQWPAEPERII
ncbi:tail fiber assembly protein [Aeromonas sp. QDB14]|uniref:tail fiber assembly protein n=1 Tax=Aeromonas sp. QDB14 TaxID=2989836 RepID=UPI0022E5F452|nr:tail fiber assembly protein [Aeromonas sp. QDB14]